MSCLHFGIQLLLQGCESGVEGMDEVFNGSGVQYELVVLGGFTYYDGCE